MENNENLIKNSPEKVPEINMVEITDENKEILLGLRAVIDKDFKYDNIDGEMESYSRGANKKAFIAMEGTNPIGYVEVILNIDLEDLSESEKYLQDHGVDLNLLATLARIGVIKEAQGRKKSGGISVGEELLRKAESWVVENGKKFIWLDYLAPKTDGDSEKDKARVAYRQKLDNFYIRNNYKEVGDGYKDLNKDKYRKVAVKDLGIMSGDGEGI